jgi:DNA-binding SARP family transcriptional activator
MHVVMPTKRGAARSKVKSPRVGRLLLRDAGRFEPAGGPGHDLEPKDALLLAYLVIEGPTPRGRLATSLWPDVDEERARGNLRQRLLRLKRTTGVELVAGNPLAQLAEGIAHDLADAHELLAGIEFEHAGGLSEWLGAERERRRRALGDGLRMQAERAEADGDLSTALDRASALLDISPLSEQAHRRVMRLHYLCGDAGAALASYERCAQLLRSQLGAEPSKETLQLRSQIERALPAAPDVERRQGVPVTLLRPPQTIGRAAERAAVENAWAEGRAVLVTGEAGIGKTRLLQEFCLAHPGAIAIDTRPGDAEVPLALASRMLRAVAARFPAAAEAEPWSSLVDMLPGFAARSEGGRSAGRRGVGPVVAEVLAAAAQSGLSGLVIDDLQYGDAASLDLLLETIDCTVLGDVRWAFGSRPAESTAAAQSLARFGDRSRAVQVRLAPFDVVTLEAFVESLLVFEDWKPLAAKLMRRVGGNPMFALEALRQAHASGAMRIDVPARVLELMDRRLSTIPEPALALARIAAIARDDFSPELAEAVSGLSPLALASPWHELEAANVLVGDAFTHDLVYEAAVRSVPASIARRLHATVADFLERRAGEPAPIAQHYLDAGCEAKAVPHLASAARRAWAVGRGTEAGAFFLRAAEIERTAGRLDSAFDILFEGADALSDLGPIDLLERVVEMARPMAKTALQLAALKFLDAVMWHMRGDFAAFSQFIDEALLLAISSGHARVEAECRFCKGFIARTQGRIQEAIEHVAAAVTVCRGVGLERRALAMESSLAGALTMAGLPLRAKQLHYRLEPLLLQADQVAIAHHFKAANAFAVGAFDACLEATRQSLVVLDRVEISDVERASTARGAISCFRRLGHFSEGLAVLDRAGSSGRASPVFAVGFADERARLYLDLGRPDLAERWLALAEGQGSTTERGRIKGRIARAHCLLALNRDPWPALADTDPARTEELATAWDWMLLRGHVSGTRQAVDQCEGLLARCRAGGAAGLEAPLLPLLARLLADVGDTKPATVAARQAVATLEAGRLGAMLPVCALWLHRVLEAAGRRVEARQCVRDSVDWLQRTAEEHVPPEFRDGYLNRNPVNRQLLTLATRLK